MKKKKALNTVLMVVSLCVWVFSVVIVSQLVVGFIMLSLLGKTQFNTPLWTSIYSAVVYLLALFVTIFVPIAIENRRKKGKKEEKEKKKDDFVSPAELKKDLGIVGLPTWTDIGLAPVGLIISLLLAAVLVSFFNLFPWFDAEQAQDVGYSVYLSGFGKILAFFTLVVVAPIAEEIIFRGWLYTKLRETFHKKISNGYGIVLSSLIVSVLFGLIHLQWNVGVNVFALSIVLCALREITGTIYAGILTHMLKNGVAFYLLYVVGVV